MIVQGRKTHRIFLARAPPTTGWEASTDTVRKSLTEGAAQLGKVSVHSNLLFGALQGCLHISGRGTH